MTAAEKVMRVFELRQLSGERLNLEVLKIIGGPPQDHIQHAMDTQNGAGNHYFTVVRKLCWKFQNIRKFHAAKRLNEALHPKKNRVKRNKLTIFSGE